MPLKYRFLLGVFAGACLGTYAEARRLARNHNKLVEQYNTLVDRYDTIATYCDCRESAVIYLLSVLEARAIDLTEFDLIALRNIVLPD